jgi:hypothetical protein|tara:strand:+ start:142 stop:603 length:462 start_codon:yes stop_codon:yes gene_type:complete
MANFNIVPYKVEHGDHIIEFGMNHKLMEIDASYTKNRIDAEYPGLAFTLLKDNEPIISGGLYPMWEGVAEGWALASKQIFENKIKAASTVKKRLDVLCINNKITRLQTSVKEEFKLGMRFAEWLGLESEGLMKQYGPDGSNYYRMAKIYELYR